jgi:beta-lactamase superfamily II metal-dependent hydrolase
MHVLTGGDWNEALTCHHASPRPYSVCRERGSESVACFDQLCCDHTVSKSLWGVWAGERAGVAVSDEVSVLSVEMLPARQGDCILLTWGQRSHRHRMLIDAGPASAYDGISARLRALDVSFLDLLVLTHIDADHVEGTILLTNDKDLGIDIGEVWFNGAPQLAYGELAPVHGEILGAITHQRGLRWNHAFGKRAVMVPDEGALASQPMCCDLNVTVLGPDRRTLRALRDVWQQACAQARVDFGSEDEALNALRNRPKLLPKDSYLSKPPVPKIQDLARRRSGTDTSIPNASSIVLLAEFGNRRLLLAGDATPGSLLPGIKRLLTQRGQAKLQLTAFKVAHHGSAKNLTDEIVRLAPAEHYLFSSNGSYFRHPDDTAVATVVRHGPLDTELVFNYTNPRTQQWDDKRLIDEFKYRVRYTDESETSAQLSWPVETP